jgi:hypothetical protein
VQRCFHSGNGIAKRHTQCRFKIGTTLRSAPATLSTASTAASPAKHAAKKIAEVAAFITASTRIETGATAATTETHSAHRSLTTNLVVLSAFRFIANNVVRR